ncbi:MAG: MotA/TolQ/ExbB proton channel family protein [Planctomycetia bacterium]|nr:MotA/TolQ/ExbB proton channel family protein [Planctomycetia bacterium]
MSRINRFALAVVRSSILWGSLASLGFFTLIHTGVLSDVFFSRYFAGHWVEYCETIMFFIGLAQLILRAGDIAEQRANIGKVKFEETVPVGDCEVEARTLLTQLEALPASTRESYLPRRLRETLDAICRKSSADDLQDDLRFYSDVDAGRAHSSYAMVRIIIWAIPILGFLGTVIGITIAIAGLDPKLLENSLPIVTSGLGVAFDTTALALALSMVLMFGQFFIDKQEARLLSDVDNRANDMLTPRFPPAGSEQDPQLNGVRRMAEAVISSVERTVERQAEIWNHTISVSNERWESVTSAGREQLEEAFGKALARSMETHRKHMTAIEDGSAEQNRKHWLQVQHALEACAASNASQQLELRRQADSLLQIVNGAGQVRQLEDALSRNLTTLSASQHLQETLMNLTGAVNLLNARLERISTPAGSYSLPVNSSSVSKAA